MRGFGQPTRTIALLEVSGEAFAEIRSKLESAGYEHAFGESDGVPTIDMHGIGLKPALAPPAAPYPPIAQFPSDHVPGEVTTLEFGPAGTTTPTGEPSRPAGNLLELARKADPVVVEAARAAARRRRRLG